MIQPNELRLGNIVFDHDREKEVVIDEDYLEVLMAARNYDNVSPVPLSEEWLLKFRLLNNDIGIWNNGDAIYFDYGFEKSIKLNFVHQLQNLIFTLKQEELKIIEL